MRKCVAGMLAVAMCVTVMGGSVDASAVAKPKLSNKKLSLTVGGTKTLKVTKAKGAKLTWKSSKKKVADVKKSGKYKGKVTAKAKGSAVITCKVKGKKTYSLKCKVTVKKKTGPLEKTPAPTSPAQTQTPIPPAQTQIPGNTATAVPGGDSPAPSASVTDAPDLKPDLTSNSIRKRYQGIFQYMGSSLNYAGWRGNNDLQDEDTLAFVKENFNSFTLEDEMKPNDVLGTWNHQTITIEDALELGYVIPDNYTESKVPKLNLDKLDQVLEVAYNNGLKMRAHVLTWHQQTPDWFFTTSYSGNKAVKPEVMDARLEFYIRTVMKHMMEKEKEICGEAGKIIYVWDVTNEYLHRDNQPGSKTWVTVYGDLGLEPTYVKKAFEFAYDMLKEYNVQDKVTLFYNDYDTYFCSDDLVSLVNYINEGEEAKICGGIGMQTHVDVDRPTLDEYGAAMDKFLATGLEVQVTELDVTTNFDPDNANVVQNKGQTNEDQAEYVGDLMKLIVMKQKQRDKIVSPKGITGITIWGLCDAYSWRKEFKPLLFGKDVNDPKPSFQAFIDAAKLWVE